ncbi:MAG TPA: phosphatase PAP2 family protein [Dermatophilaceae bacterium]|nr:phosphatase PAP2 family protein [Dermatophilaceae bacterium]
MTRVGWPTWLALWFAGLFVALTVLMVTRVTQSLDTQVIHHFRPEDVWGPSQIRVSPWMSRLRPERMYLLLAFTSLVMSLWRRSWWPVVYSTVLAGASMAVTLVVKFAIERPDPHGDVAASGGSYPSGHVVAVVVCLAGCIFVVWPRARWWLWLPMVSATGLMITALIVSAAHWPSDVLAGALLGLAVVTGGSRLRLRRRAHEPAATGDGRPLR